MVKLRMERVLPFEAGRLWEMVGDVEKYPDYIPWITTMYVTNTVACAEGVSQLDAEAGVGFKYLSERFQTRVTRDQKQKTIDIVLLRGPFKRLNCTWKFSDDPKGAFVEFNIDFDFKNPFLDGFLKANIGKAVTRLMACFEGRAERLYPKLSLQ
jgi:coenzyme Q-binding protein COQ10